MLPPVIGVELKRVIGEWRLRLGRARDVLAPQRWSDSDWKVFACSVAILVQRHGVHWEDDDRLYWDLRWNIRDGGQLICQVEQESESAISVVIAQSGGFAGDGTYTWLWTEFNPQGEYIREPYWVDGMWKEALVAMLLPYSMRAGFLLGDRAETPDLARLRDAASAC